MSNTSGPPRDGQPRDTAYWAQYVSTLKVTRAPTGALNLNVEGHRLVGPLQGFGQMWQKIYWIGLKGGNVTPTELITIWKHHFPEFWPRQSHFYPSLSGIAPGEVALINATIPGGLPVPVSSGVRRRWPLAPHAHVTGSLLWRESAGTNATKLHRSTAPVVGGQERVAECGHSHDAVQDADTGTLDAGVSQPRSLNERRTQCIAKSSQWGTPYISCSSISPSGY